MFAAHPLEATLSPLKSPLFMLQTHLVDFTVSHSPALQHQASLLTSSHLDTAPR